MIFFSWKKILRKTGQSSQRIVLAMRALVSNTPPKNRYDPVYNYYYSDFSGQSFLINPESLLRAAMSYRPKEVAQYIGLAALRNYAEYRVTGDASLDLFHSPVSEDNINSNRLLRIKDGRIYFYFEEAPKRRNKIWH